jgi:hypothetical protein
MVDQVWISEVMSNNELGNKVGIRQKWFGEPWEAPYVNHYVPKRSESVKTAMYAQYAGQTLKRENMPEASAVYSMPHFGRAKDVFFAGGFLAVKGKVAEVLSKFDFGAGGGLVPYTIYEADEKTPLPGPFYIVNFGPFKDCFLPDASTNIRNLPSTIRRVRPFGRSAMSRTATSRFRPRAWQGRISGCAAASRAASS